MLKIEAGKYYETADGVRVGPMLDWDHGRWEVLHPWQSGEECSTRFNRGGDLWRSDGTSDYCPTLVREVS